MEDRKLNRDVQRAKLDKIRQDEVKEVLFGPIASARTPEQWSSAQSSGFIPKNMSFDKREPFLMSYMGERALETVEVGDASSPTGTRRVRKYDAEGMPGKPKSGTKLSVDKNGSVTFEQGAGVTGALDKTNKRKIEEKAFNAQEAISRYRGIKDSFKPDLLRAKPKMLSALAQAKDFFSIDVTDEERQLVTEMTTMYRRSAENLALFIKDISGAAVSEQEADRLSKVMPNTNDTPMVFEAKLNDALKQTQFALWRYHYALNKGLDPINTGLSTYDMESIIDQEGKNIELAIRQKNAGMPEQEVNARVVEALQSIFGSM